MKPVISTARDYFLARFYSDDDDEGSMAEERFKDVLALGRLATLLRLHVEYTDAELEAIVASAPKRILPQQADRNKIKTEWKAAKLLSQPLSADLYREPATTDSPHHISRNGEYCYQWWVQRSLVYPSMHAMARRMVILQPSSAASERVFSLFKHVNDTSPPNTLMDLKRARVVVPYNDRMRKKCVVSSH
jgi:hypothetical protein